MSDPANPTSPPPDLDRAWLLTLTVLYVEDDETTREQLGRFLRRRVGRLVEAADGAEGLARYRTEHPALLITDIQMPNLDGLALAEEIRRQDAGFPIVVTTAFEQIGYLQRSIDAGVDKYVTKPVDTDKLEAALLACARRLRTEALLAHERERALEALRAHEREAIGLLAGGLAHDFNNLLQAIIGGVALGIPLAQPGSELRELLEDALKACLEAGALGGRLLTLCETWPANLSTAPVGPTLRAALATALAGSDTRLRLELPEELPAIPHDAELLGRAFGQLAQNAREAMAGRGLLTVSARLQQLADGEVPSLAAGAYLAVSFKDQGPGIAPQILPRIFDAYFSTKPRGSVRGMGLGLSLSLAVLRKHRGLITAASRPGAGAELTVFLPTSGPDGLA